VGYWLGEPFWGNGIISSAIRLMCEEAFAATTSCAYTRNLCLQHGFEECARKSGFILEGIKKNSVYKNGTVYDSACTHCFGKIRQIERCLGCMSVSGCYMIRHSFVHLRIVRPARV
jgi:RimJ/RimL family protein N-acetyltransferase